MSLKNSTCVSWRAVRLPDATRHHENILRLWAWHGNFTFYHLGPRGFSRSLLRPLFYRDHAIYSCFTIPIVLHIFHTLCDIKNNVKYFLNILLDTDSLVPNKWNIFVDLCTQKSFFPKYYSNDEIQNHEKAGNQHYLENVIM